MRNLTALRHHLHNDYPVMYNHGSLPDKRILILVCVIASVDHQLRNRATLFGLWDI